MEVLNKLKTIGLITVLMLLIISIGLFSFVKYNPPLVIGTVATSVDEHIVIVGIGNKGVNDVKVKKVLINDNEEPSKQKIQVSNPLKGFIISDDSNSEARNYHFVNIGDVTIQSNTSPATQFAKLDNGTATESDKIYGLTV
jgi:hypothetical protein